MITNDAGSLVNQQRYMPFGQVRYLPGTPAITSTDFGYTGQRELDPQLGLMDYKARFYSPLLGRFVQPDTVTPEGPQGLNRYAYVNNNPIKYVDPSGHSPCDLLSGHARTACENSGYGADQRQLDLEKAYKDDPSLGFSDLTLDIHTRGTEPAPQPATRVVFLQHSYTNWNSYQIQVGTFIGNSTSVGFGSVPFMEGGFEDVVVDLPGIQYQDAPVVEVHNGTISFRDPIPVNLYGKYDLRADGTYELVEVFPVYTSGPKIVPFIVAYPSGKIKWKLNGIINFDIDFSY